MARHSPPVCGCNLPSHSDPITEITAGASRPALAASGGAIDHTRAARSRPSVQRDQLCAGPRQGPE